MTPSTNQYQQGYSIPPTLSNEFVDIDQTLVFNYSLPAGQKINGLSQPISGDGDFYLCAMQMIGVIYQTATLIELAGDAGVRIADDTGYKLMNEYINIYFMTPIAGNSYPYVIQPLHRFKAGTRINIDLQENSNIVDGLTGPRPNLIQIAFRGFYRYRVAALLAQQQLLRKVGR